jgi:hypothetical protein
LFGSTTTPLIFFFLNTFFKELGGIVRTPFFPLSVLSQRIKERGGVNQYKLLYPLNAFRGYGLNPGIYLGFFFLSQNFLKKRKKIQGVELIKNKNEC